ncbi:MAG TPA: AMP-binding protein [Gemmatimonadaceae bacterium]|nr:AMP-binding protein [Gemmatimonadaceae bacterium]
MTGHLDTFCADNLPPRDLWPVTDWTGVPELAYPARMNCATALLGPIVETADADRVAFRFPGGTWTYRELDERSNRIARVLVEDLGVIPGNRVLLRGANTPMMAACWFAVLKAGGVVVCTMPLLRTRELAYIADKARVSLALTDGRVAADCDQAMAARSDGTPRAGARVVRFGVSDPGSLEERMAGKPPTFTSRDLAADDIALIAFTSGTTGQGKGTMHSHRDVMAITDCFPRYVVRPRPEDLFIGSPPFAFTYALGGLLLFPIRFGASVVLLEQATPPFLLAAIGEYRPTVCFTAPTAYRAMLALMEQNAAADVSSLRRCVSAGEALPLATYQAWLRRTNIRIIDGIGSTEMLHVFISAADDDIRPGATGRVVPGYTARVVDEDGREVPRGEIGRLAVRGPTGCRYLDDAARQTAYVQHGWNLTGDSYHEDADGYFWYHARTDDMIISSGYNISGPEVENVLLEHASVQECAVVGVADEERGQRVTAYIVLRPDVAGTAALVKELQDFVKREIAPYKYPRAIEFVDALPRTATGKLQRYRLREAHP